MTCLYLHLKYNRLIDIFQSVSLELCLENDMLSSKLHKFVSLHVKLNAFHNRIV